MYIMYIIQPIAYSQVVVVEGVMEVYDWVGGGGGFQADTSQYRLIALSAHVAFPAVCLRPLGRAKCSPIVVIRY